MRIKLIWSVCLISYCLAAGASLSVAATYSVRTDGGTSAQCTGLVDAPYPGSGTAQPCAWSHLFWAIGGNNPPIWNIQGGDTVIIHSGSYRMGLGAPNTDWCEADGAFDCHLPPLPSGPDAAHPTRIVGSGWDQGCLDPPELWAAERSYQILSLENTSHAVIACLELTDHSGCVEFHTDPQVACKRNTPPFGDWGHAGIFAADSSDVLLQNVNIHGMAEKGIWAGRISDWTMNHVRIAGNGWVGWDGDLGGGNSSNSGKLVFGHVTVEWNGCAETYPSEDPDHCWDQTAGGYGDGLGTAATAGQWFIEHSIFRYNTSDGLDLLYLGQGITEPTYVEVKGTRAYGNAGNQLKVRGPAKIENCLVVGNCGYFQNKSFGQEMSDHCRAMGNSLSMTLGSGESASVVNSTIVGHGDCLVELECGDPAGCGGSEKIILQNSIFVGSQEFLDPSDTTCLVYDPDSFATGQMDYNVIYSVKGDPCPLGAHDHCRDPLFMNGSFEQFDGRLQSGSPAIDSGMAVGSLGGLIPGVDLIGRKRPQGQGVDRGAYERPASLSAIILNLLLNR